MMLKNTMTLRLAMKVQLASCRVFENAFAETEKGIFSRGKYLWQNIGIFPSIPKKSPVFVEK